MKELTDNQKGVLEVLRRRGAEFTASATERHWRKGESYYLDDRNAAAEGIRRKFAQGNNEVELPKGHRPAVPDLLEALREAADGMGGSFAIWEPKARAAIAKAGGFE